MHRPEEHCACSSTTVSQTEAKEISSSKDQELELCTCAQPVVWGGFELASLVRPAYQRRGSGWRYWRSAAFKEKGSEHMWEHAARRACSK